MEECKNLNEVRENIDKIDEEIVKLIAKRSTYVTQAANLKKTTDDVRAPERVELIINKMRDLAKKNRLNPDVIEVVYRNMIDAFITLELKEYQDIADMKNGKV